MIDSEVEKLILKEKRGRLMRIKALVIKECYQIIRDPSTLLITIFLPLLLIFLYGSGVSLDLDHLKVGLVLEDTSPDAQSFSQSLTDSHYFEVKKALDIREIDEDLTRGTLRGMFIIPSYFTQFQNLPNTVAPIQVIADGSETNTANFVINYAQGVFQNWIQQEKIVRGNQTKEAPLIQIESRFWYNEELKSRFFLLSGSLAITMTLIGSLLTALVVAREWERGTMEALMSTTVGIYELVIAKILPYFVLGLISMGISVFLSVFCYGLPLRGSIFLLTLLSAIFLFCALGLGLMISTLTKNQVFAYQITLITAFLPSYILSGFLFEILSMPKWTQMISSIIPAKYFVQSLQTLFLVGNVWDLIFYDISIIAAIGSLFFMITAFKTVKRLD